MARKLEGWREKVGVVLVDVVIIAAMLLTTFILVEFIDNILI